MLHFYFCCLGGVWALQCYPTALLVGATPHPHGGGFPSIYCMFLNESEQTMAHRLMSLCIYSLCLFIFLLLSCHISKEACRYFKWKLHFQASFYSHFDVNCIYRQWLPEECTLVWHRHTHTHKSLMCTNIGTYTVAKKLDITCMYTKTKKHWCATKCITHTQPSWLYPKSDGSDFLHNYRRQVLSVPVTY